MTADADKPVTHAELRTELGTLETRIDAKIDTLETRIDAKLDALETRLETRIDAKIGASETRTTALMREMWRDILDAIRQQGKQLTERMDAGFAATAENFRRLDRNDRRLATRVDSAERAEIEREAQLDEHETRIRRIEEHVGLKPV